MYDWVIWLIAQIPLALVLAIAYFGRDALANWLNARTKHSFDAKLEGLKADLAAKSKEIDALRSAPLSARTARQAMVDKRRIEAIDQTWGALKVMQPGKAAAGILAVMDFDTVAELAKKDSRVREMFKSFGDMSRVGDLFKHEAHAAKPYMSPLTSALLTAYATGIALGQVRFIVLQTGMGKDAISSSAKMLNTLAEALPDWAENIQKNGEGILHLILEELEKRLLVELQRSLVGADDDEEQLAHAKRIVERAREAELDMQGRQMEAATGHNLRRGARPIGQGDRQSPE